MNCSGKLLEQISVASILYQLLNNGGGQENFFLAKKRQLKFGIDLLILHVCLLYGRDLKRK